MGHGDTFCTIGHVGKEVMFIFPRWRLAVAECGDWGGIGPTKLQLLAGSSYWSFLAWKGTEMRHAELCRT
jgi:hypothetical protein